MAQKLNLSRANLDKVSGGYTTLNQCEDPTPLGWPLPIYVTPFQREENVTSEAEVEAAVLRLKRKRDGVNTHLQDEDLQGCLREA